ncbi:MAG TPA: sensor histidine kinase [Solirubrobacterales bacterium]|jgi:two-component system sensor histidine kinase UhpB|nr:sensor histidine kinase [Solirubrobacterales bacterium]
MRRGTLLTQVLLVNLLLIAAAVIAASIASNPENSLRDSASIGLVLGFALAATVAVNIWLLSRRFEPLQRLVAEMQTADLSKPPEPPAVTEGPVEVVSLERSFHAMLERLEAERRGAANAALSAQERERERIARDLHDEVNQALTALLLRLEAVRRQAPDPEVAAELAEIGSLISRAMSELLDLARGLRPTTLDDLGLKAALATLVEEVEREAGIAAGFEAEGELDGVPDDVQLVTYRVAQEAVTNVIQHADAGHLRVRLIGAADGAIELRVSDDGAGYAGGRSKERLGIAGMRERALLCGGELTVESEPGAGTRVTLQA